MLPFPYPIFDEPTPPNSAGCRLAVWYFFKHLSDAGITIFWISTFVLSVIALALARGNGISPACAAEQQWLLVYGATGLALDLWYLVLVELIQYFRWQTEQAFPALYATLLVVVFLYGWAFYGMSLRDSGGACPEPTFGDFGLIAVLAFSFEMSVATLGMVRCML